VIRDREIVQFVILVSGRAGDVEVGRIKAIMPASDIGFLIQDYPGIAVGRAAQRPPALTSKSVPLNA
jgi:hypothetical protein